MRLFLEELGRRVLVCDGAMGTMLYASGVFVNRSFEELNVSEPELVESVHRAYRDAGADVLETNTFGANALKLSGFGLHDRLGEINQAGVRLARQVAGDSVYVAGAIGPLGVPIEPHGKTTRDEAERYFREHAEALRDAGVDLFILETFRGVDELRAALRAVRAVTTLPVVAQMTTSEDGSTPDGLQPEEFSRQVVGDGADVVGVNCGTGPAAMLETVERIAAVTDRPLAAQPNAGMPRAVEGRTLYLSSPEYVASYARRFVRAGVRLVGGCCGTTPAHTKEISAAVGSAMHEVG
jgi:homocysteine S-methyltransferase